MRKIVAFLLAGCMVFSACAAGEIPAENPIETPEITTTPPPVTTTTPATTTAPATTTSQPDLTPSLTDEEYRLQIAERIAEAFLNKDVDFLDRSFLDYGRKAFDFVKELDFIEFDLIEYEHKEENHTWSFYFNITVENGTDDIFTLGGREWELQLNDSFAFSAFRQFSPRGKIINEHLNEDGYALMCMQFSSYLRFFETMSDFNFLKEMERLDGYLFYLSLWATLRAIDDFAPWAYEANDFIERIKYHFNIDSTIEQLIEAHPWFEDSVEPTGHGGWWYYCELISEEYNETHGTVIINWYADTAYFIVAKTMKYNLEFGEKGVKLISTELLYSDDDLILASNGT